MRCVLILTLLSFSCSTAFAEARPCGLPEGSRGRIAADGDAVVWSTSASLTAASARATTGLDTFVLYGGPDRPLEGKFEDQAGSASWNGWTSYDATEIPGYWHVSSFNAANLGAHGPGNLALWCGQDAEAQPGWVTPPGYGNLWNEVALYESDPVADSSLGQTVELDFLFNHDLEPGWDYFYVEYDSAGLWRQLCRLDGANTDSLGAFPAPGRRFSDVAAGAIVFAGGDYGGAAGDRIRIRLRVWSDGGYSDEDGFFDSVGGAVQVDDVTLTTAAGSFFEDFEGPGPYLFAPERPPIAGDFAEVYPGFADIDPCRANPTAVLGFIDYGQQVRNGPGATGLTSTGGSTSPGVNYGVPGNWVTNYTGGLSLGLTPLHNGITSPEIAWDLPGAEDDDPDIVGLEVSFDVWQDLPLMNGIVFGFEIRSAAAGQPMPEHWEWNQWWYYSSLPSWKTRTFDAGELVVPYPERLQIRLFARDVADIFGLPGNAGTPSPLFDNVCVRKYRVGGILLGAGADVLAQDGFPVSGSVDASSPAARDALDVPIDMARDTNSGDLFIVPGDSIVVRAAALIPGSSIADLRLVWALKKNPLFEDALRSPPVGWRHVHVDTSDPLVWTGEVLADSCRTAGGAVIDGEFFFDLPDVDFLYPGDVLQTYVVAEDSDGRITTLPEDLAGFGSFDHSYTRLGTVRALPALSDPSGSQPSTLVLVDTGRDDRFAELVTSLAELGMAEGVDYDIYWRKAALYGGISSGIGSAGGHGATLNQISGYSSIFYFSGYNGGNLLSDGVRYDKSDDLGLLEAWHRQAGRRSMAYFGDRIAEHLMRMADGVTYLTNTIGAGYMGRDVIPFIGGQTTPLVQPVHAAFGVEYLLDFNCQRDETNPDRIGVIPHNHVVPEGAADYGHLFVDPVSGTPMAGPAASTILANPHPDVTGYDVLFPYSIAWLYPRPMRGAVAVSDRTLLLQELLALFGEPGGSGGAVAVPPRTTLSLRAIPNPFNPRTVVQFDVPPGETGMVRVYNLRGELVRALHHGEYRSTEFSWDGNDETGAPVASGVYVVRATAGTESRSLKIAIVR